MRLRHSRKIYIEEVTTQKQLEEIVTLKDGRSFSLRKLLDIVEDLDITNIQEIWAVKGEYVSKNLIQVVGQIKRWGILKFYLWSNKLPSIIKSFVNIDFYQLKELHIGKNRINSIENLQRVKFLELTDLGLEDNQITSLKSLKKCDLPKIKDLCLRGNFINFVKVLNQGNFPCLINLNFNKNINTENRDFMKIPSQVIQVLRIRTKVNIRELSFLLQTIFQRKWKKLKIIETIKD